MPDATIYKEEIFGPVVVISGFTDEQTVVEKANDSKYGLHSAVFTQDINRAMRLSSKVSSGTVCINCTIMVDVGLPFGGCRQSGWGREGGKVSPRILKHALFTNLCRLEWKNGLSQRPFLLSKFISVRAGGMLILAV